MRRSNESGCWRPATGGDWHRKETEQWPSIAEGAEELPRTAMAAVVGVEEEVESGGGCWGKLLHVRRVSGCGRLSRFKVGFSAARRAGKSRDRPRRWRKSASPR